MSIHREDLFTKAKKVDAKLYDAMTRINFAGGAVEISRKVKALEYHPWLNTPEEKQWLIDAKYYLLNQFKLR